MRARERESETKERSEKKSKPKSFTLTSAINSTGWSPTPPLAAIEAIWTTPDPSFSTEAGAASPPWTIGGSCASDSPAGGAAASASASADPGAGAPLPPTSLPFEDHSKMPSLDVYRALPSSETVR